MNNTSDPYAPRATPYSELSFGNAILLLEGGSELLLESGERINFSNNEFPYQLQFLTLESNRFLYTEAGERLDI